MKPTDDINDSFFLTDPPGLLDNVTNARMRTTGNDHQSIFGTIMVRQAREGRES